jgi:hypothetical protein
MTDRIEIATILQLVDAIAVAAIVHMGWKVIQRLR